MLRQRRLVALLLLSIGLFHSALTSTPRPLTIVHDDIPDSQLDMAENEIPAEKPHIKISTPKVKEVATPSTTTTTSTSTNSRSKVSSMSTHKPVSENTLNDLVEAAKHSEALAKDTRFNLLLAEKYKGSTTTEKIVEDSYDDYNDNYDYDEDEYNYDESAKTKASSTTTKNKQTTTTAKPTKKKVEMKARVEEAKPLTSTAKAIVANKEHDNNNQPNAIETVHDNNSNSNSNSNTDDEDEDDYDEDEDEDDDDFDSENDIADEEDVVFSENVPCPRYCICERNINSYLVAHCSRFDPGTQKFGKDITDLIVTDVGPKYPILLGPDFFLQMGLKHVSSIKIANCTIEYLHPDAFNGLDDLFAVNLTNVGLAIINPDTFSKNKKLRLLTISGNDLSVMSSVHYLLKSSSIEELDLSRNNLMELNPNAFSQLTNIVYINLSQNNLQKIPEKVFDPVGTIEELDLSYNSLETLPAAIFNRTALAILHLKSNAITGDLRFGTSDLQQLDLSFNSIHQVHHGMFDKLTGLTNLNLKGNGITKIQPDSFLPLKNLRHIDLSINELDQVSSMVFYKNSELDVIRLNDNPRLSQLPTDGFRSYNGVFTVYYLDISNCAVGALGHRTFSTMPHLATLKLAWNNINNLDPDTFASLTKLIDLDLSNNLITKLDELTFMNNNDLTKLNLAGNPMRKLSVRLFLPLSKLRELDVSDCELNSLLSDNQYGVGRKYKFYETLRTFNASSNQITRVRSADVRNFKNLRSLDISHNPLKCNEDFQDFISYVSLNTHMMPHKMPQLANLESDSSLLELQAQAGWSTLAHEVCKHHESLFHKAKVEKIEQRIEKVDKDLDDDAKGLLNIMKNSKLQKILKDSRKSEVVIHDDDDGGHLDEDSREQNSNNAEEVKDDDEANDSDYDDEEDDDDDEDGEGKSTSNEKDDFITIDRKAVLSKVKSHGVHVEEVDVRKETDDKFLLNKLITDKFNEENSDNNNNSEEDKEFIIENGRVYYSGYRVLLPVLIAVTCVVFIVIGLVKIVAMILEKRGERYRMSLLAASKNSIVYQKLSEEIKRPTKEPKQPKVHRYTPINQV